MRRIRTLENEAIESRNAAIRAREEMAFFKRELLNREENYNKKFNANPVVGVMQVCNLRRDIFSLLYARCTM